MKKAAAFCEVSRWKLLKSQLNNLHPEEFQKGFASKDAILVDVRTAEEFATGHLPGAMNLDYFAYEFIDRLEELDVDANYFVYCRSSRRSLRACTLMRNGGFKNIFHLDGGLVAWQDAGLAVG